MRRTDTGPAVDVRRARAFSAPAGFAAPPGFGPEDWAQLHPRPPQGPLYHNAQHSLNAMEVMGRLSQWWFPGEVDFLSKAAALHDVDPGRRPGTPPRVPATLAWMESRRRELMRRFFWSELQFETAKALVMRTGLRADAAGHRAYKAMLLGLPKERRAFTLRAGAILSEYADRASWYMQDHRTAGMALRGLLNEQRTQGGTPQPPRGIGAKTSFIRDEQLAGELELTPPLLPLIDEVLSYLPPDRSSNFKSNIALYSVMHEQASLVIRNGGSQWDS